MNSSSLSTTYLSSRDVGRELQACQLESTSDERDDALNILKLRYKSLYSFFVAFPHLFRIHSGDRLFNDDYLLFIYLL